MNCKYNHLIFFYNFVSQIFRIMNAQTRDPSAMDRFTAEFVPASEARNPLTR